MRHYGDDPLQESIVYVPRGACRRARAVVVFAYGGSWTTGAVWPYRFVGRCLVGHRPAAVVGYRHAPEARHPAQIEDLTAATVSAVHELRRRGCSAERVVLAGHSAGAHLMALAAIEPACRDRLAEAGVALVGFLGVSGPLDLRLVCPTPGSCPSVAALMGKRSGWGAIDPLLRLRGDEPFEILAVHGARDTVVSALATHRFASRARDLGLHAGALYDSNGYHASVLELFTGAGPLAGPVGEWLDHLDT